MFSYLNSDAVLDALGDKVTTTIGKAVALTRDDFDEYWAAHPDWVAAHSERGLANWLHDRLWFHVTRGLDGIADIAIVKNASTSEVVVGDRFRIRIKRHHLKGEISTYPTQTALEFLDQPTGQLPGLEVVHLIAGYEWDKIALRIVRPVLSLRDGADNIIWLVELAEVAGTGPSRMPESGGATSPEVVLHSESTVQSRKRASRGVSG